MKQTVQTSALHLQSLEKTLMGREVYLVATGKDLLRQQLRDQTMITPQYIHLCFSPQYIFYLIYTKMKWNHNEKWKEETQRKESRIWGDRGGGSSQEEKKEAKEMDTEWCCVTRVSTSIESEAWSVGVNRCCVGRVSGSEVGQGMGLNTTHHPSHDTFGSTIYHPIFIVSALSLLLLVHFCLLSLSLSLLFQFITPKISKQVYIYKIFIL